MRRSLGAVLLVLAAGLVSACDTASAADPAADRKIAESSVLVAGDLGSGYTAQNIAKSDTHSPADTPRPWGSEILRCLNLSADDVGPVSAWATSPNFDASPLWVTSEVDFTASDSAAKSVMDVARRTELPECLTKGTSSLQSKGLTITSAKQLPFSKFGDDTVGIRTKSQIVDKQRRTLYPIYDVVLVRVGRSVVYMGFSYTTMMAQSFPADEATRLTRLVVERVQQNSK